MNGAGDPASGDATERAALELHYWPTPNGWKVAILLEELGVPYTLVRTDIRKGEQFSEAFLKLSPNNRMPALVDHAPDVGPDAGSEGSGEPLRVFESGAILMYLADKYGRFWPKDVRGRWQVAQWVMWQMAGLGPTAGQVHHFNEYAKEKMAYPIERFGNEIHRLYSVLDRQLRGRDFIAGDYSIADMACWPWIRLWRHHGLDIETFPDLARWQKAMAARPAVNRGFRLGNEWREGQSTMTEEARKVLLGQRGA